ncbi:hypothetical protein FXO37_03137 [Capsicum annuum]|nr:hypothetical protein FXO37_03137 [Capsicum annuum]
MPEDFPQQWERLGFTHLHIGVARIGLTYQERKGWPVVEHLSLLDTRFIKNHHANLSTSKILLDDGIVFVTMFSDFNIPLADPYLMKAMKVQVQILDAQQDRVANQETLHCQIAWRVQNHDMNLLPSSGKNSLFLTIDATDKTKKCNKIPRNISGKELVSIILAL